MINAIVLDSGPLGMICHPRANREVAAWFRRVITSGSTVFIPEIADYEVRRELIRRSSIGAYSDWTR